MANLNIEFLEKYVLAQEKEKVLSELTPYSEDYYYVELMTLLNKQEYNNELESRVSSFITNTRFQSTLINLVKLKFLLLKLQHVDGNEKSKTFEALRNFWSLTFNHVKPKTVELTGALAQEIPAKTNVGNLGQNLNQLELQKKLDSIITNKSVSEFTELNSEYRSQLDISKIALETKEGKNLFESIISQTANCDELKDFIPVYLRFVKLHNDMSFCGVINKLSLPQIELLMKEKDFQLKSQFFKKYIELKYIVDINVSSEPEFETIEPSIKTLRNLINYLKEAPIKYNETKSRAQLNLLKLLALQKNHDLNELKIYLANPLSSQHFFSTTFCNQINQKQKNEQRENLGLLSNINEQQLIEEYLKKIFQTTSDFSQFFEYFNEPFIKKLYCETKLILGQDVKNVNEIFSDSELKALNDKKALRIEDKNPKFNQDEPVRLTLTIKNISSVRAQVFELNSENYLLDNHNRNYSTIDVTGLIPCEEYLYNYTAPAMLEHKENFVFPSITSKQRGVFIIDFIGSELNSRATIVKGSLTLMSDRATGRNCTIIDEKNNICKGNQTGLFVHSKFFQADSKTGLIIIPEDVKEYSGDVVLLHEGYAEMVNHIFKDPKYQLNSVVFYNEESFLAGNEVTLLVSLNLLKNQAAWPLSTLKTVSAEVSCVNETGIQSKTNFPGLQPSEEKDETLIFVCPPELRSFSVTFKANFKDCKTEIDLVSKWNFTVQVFSNELYRVYLKKVNQDHILEVLGKNGEPIENKELILQFTPLYFNKILTLTAYTDEQGKINLGDINDASSLSVTESGVQLGNFTFKPELGYELYISKTFLENEEFEIELAPELFSKITINNCHFVQKEGVSVIKELNDKIKLQNNTIQVTGLQVGKFELKIKGFKTFTADISIIKGQRFDLNGKNIRTENDIKCFPLNDTYLLPQLSENDKEFEIKINLKETEKLRAHLFIRNYLNNKQHDFSISNQKNLRTMTFVNLSALKNSYESERRLNDEALYVNDRKNKKTYMGNTLDKPGIILKRVKVGETSEGVQNVNKGQNFQNQMARTNAESAHLNRAQTSCAVISANIIPVEFLKEPGQLIPNLKFENGILKIDKQQFKNGKNGSIILSNGKSSVIIDLGGFAGETNKKDLRLAQTRKEGFIYFYDRKYTFVQQNKQYQIQNIKNTEFTTLKTVGDLFEALCILSQKPELKSDWDFLAKWNEMTPMEKLKKYDKFCSHELNIFTFFKDKEFFESVVKPFLLNKIEKTLIDYYLLEDFNNLDSKFGRVDIIKQANWIELVLIAHGLRNKNPLVSNGILENLKMNFNLQKIAENQLKRIFDTVLNNVENEFDKKNKESNLFGGGQQIQNIQGTNSNFGGVQQQYSRGGIGVLSNIAPMVQMQLMNNIQYPQMGYNQKDNLEMNMEMDMNQDEYQQVDVFKPMQGTVEYKEKNYYYKTDLSKNQNKFRYQAASHMVKNNTNLEFFSEYFGYMTEISECIFVLALTDLGFEKKKVDSKLDDQVLTLNSVSNFVLVSKEIMEKPGEKEDLDVLVAQRYFDTNDRYKFDEDDTSVKMEKSADEFIKGNTYGCRIVITNSTTTDLEFTNTYEIPQGSIPVGSSNSMKLEKIRIGAFQSKVIEFSFYFPCPGKFDIFPSTVIRNEKIVAVSKPIKFVVKDKREIKSGETLTQILSTGEIDKIIEFIKTKNILNTNIFNIRDVYWLCKNKQFYEKILQVLRSKGYFDSTVWSYSLYHLDEKGLSEYLQSSPNLFSQFVSLKNNLVDYNSFELREYYPLVNPRAHSLGSKQDNILNVSFKKTYQRFLMSLFEKGKVEQNELVAFCNYLILQDRVEEATKLHSTIKTTDLQLECKIQYDYLSAYLDFVTGFPQFKIAKSICAEYLTYPVLSWRNLFVEIANQLAEFEESETTPIELRDEKEDNKKKAQRAPNFKCEIENQKIKVITEKLKKLSVKYYKIDLELLFSIDPFKSQNQNTFKNLSPFLEEEMNIEDKEEYNVVYHTIPNALINENLLIQLSFLEKGSKKSEFLEFTPFSLSHHVNKEFGIVKIINPNTKKPVPKIYLKCFAQFKDNTVKFYKDGYTDLRGSFDFVSLNKDKIDDVSKFSILILSENNGAKIFQCDPPEKIGKVEGEAKQLISAQWQEVRGKKMQSKNMEYNVYQQQI